MRGGGACYARRRTDFGALLEDADGEVGVSSAAELLQPDRRGEPRGPGAHDDHVVAQRLPPAAEPPGGAPALRERAAGRRARCPRCRRQRSPRRSRGFPDGPLHYARLLGSRDPEVFWDFWRSGGLALYPSGGEGRGRHGSMGQESGSCWVLHFFCVLYFCLDEIAEVDEDKQLSLI